MSKLHIFLATPCYGGTVTHRYFHSVLSLLLYGAAHQLAVTVETLARDSLIPRARNTLVAKFLSHPEATHLLFVDADIGFEIDHLLGLIALDEAIAACTYALKQICWDQPAIARAKAGELITSAPLRYVGTPCPAAERRQKGNFITAEYAGTGFMLISRAAIQTMIAAHPELKYELAHATPDTPPEHLYALFDTMIDPQTRHYLSEDYTFCARHRALGGTIWLDSVSTLSHTGTHDFTGCPAQRKW